MGQARNRGSYEDRVAYAEATARAEQRMRDANARMRMRATMDRAAEERALTRARAADERRPVVRVGYHPPRSAQLRVALAMLGALPSMLAPLPPSPLRAAMDEFEREIRRSE